MAKNGKRDAVFIRLDPDISQRLTLAVLRAQKRGEVTSRAHMAKEIINKALLMEQKS